MVHIIDSLAKSIKTILLGVSLASILIARGGFAAEDAKGIVAGAVDLLRGHSNVSVCHMDVTTPNWERTLKMKVWDNRDGKKLFIRVLEPAKDRGVGFLRLGYNLWMYMPKVEKTIKIPPSLMLQPWMGSDFSNDDLVKESSYIDDYNHAILKEEIIGGKKVYTIELMPKPKAPVVWGRVVFQIQRDGYIPIRQSFLDEKGRLIKELNFSEVREMGGVRLPTKWEMRSVTKAGNRTVFYIDEINFNPSPPISDGIFTERNLQRGQ